MSGRFDFHLGRAAGAEPELSSTSQRSALFPWDHAGPSSSSAAGEGAHFDIANDRVSVGHHEVQIRGKGSSVGGRTSRRESSVHSSQLGGRGFSPSEFNRFGTQLGGEDFQFESTLTLLWVRISNINMSMQFLEKKMRRTSNPRIPETTSSPWNETRSIS
jgi:meiotic recombination protein REC8, fungi type